MTNRNRNSNRNSNLIVLPKGGVSLEVGRGYRGTLTVNGKRYRTRRYRTRVGAQRELNSIRSDLMDTL